MTSYWVLTLRAHRNLIKEQVQGYRSLADGKKLQGWRVAGFKQQIYIVHMTAALFQNYGVNLEKEGW